MSLQYIHTSAKRGLEPGRSGFCCVARSRDLPPDLGQELEQQSRYQHFATSLGPRILRYREVRLRSGQYYILSRIQDAGADYSKRNNHLAHHLAFRPEETTGLPNPACILLNWSGWRDNWDEPPRALDERDQFRLKDVDTRWHHRPGSEPLPPAIEKGQALSRVFSLAPGEEALLCEHYRRALNQLPSSERWRYSFTNFLLATDQPDDFVWCGVWEGAVLPFELDVRPRLLEPAPPLRQASSTETPSEPQPAPTSAGDSRPAKSKYGAPVVEIPAEYDRRKRRRPRRRFGPRELLRGINLSLTAAAVLAAAVLTVWFQRNREDVDRFIEQQRGASSIAGHDFASADRAAWERFRESGYPSEQLEEAMSLALRLASVGEDQPLRTARFLQLISTEPRLDWSQRAEAPSSLVGHQGAEARLTLDEGYQSRVATLALLPRDLAELAEPVAVSREEAPLLFSEMGQGRYSTALLRASLARYFDRARHVAFTEDSDAIAAIEAFANARQSAFDDARFAALLPLSAAFGLPDSAAYLAAGPDGLLSERRGTSYQRYLVELFSDYILAHYKDFRPTTAFQAAVARITDEERSFSNASEAARAIYEAIALAEPLTVERSLDWQRIQQAWASAFMREDLMEQTLVAYTLEAYEATKIRLLELQTRFTAEDMAAYQELADLEQRVRGFERAARVSGPVNDWIVFDPQPTH